MPSNTRLRAVKLFWERKIRRKVYAFLCESRITRTDAVIALGGGVIGDMAGFAASIYKRGVRFAYVPTTLLAQVDAAVGGKTGVNLDKYKNILGVIRQPEFTYVCPQVLESLPMEDFQAGAAEMLKTFIIEDNLKMFYYRGLKEWKSERGFLIETCLDGQDTYKALLNYFGIEYKQKI